MKQPSDGAIYAAISKQDWDKDVADMKRAIDLAILTQKTREDLQGKCHANGESCNCEYIQGQINCKLNPF